MNVGTKKFYMFSISLCLSFFCFINLKAGCAATISSPSCSYQDVCNTIASADSGDTVLIPAGTGIWTKNLIVSKSVILQGSGAGKTIIRSGYYAGRPGNTFAEENFLIVYRPSPGLNEPFRITGLTLDLDDKCGGILLKNFSTTVINKIRIDHNEIKNAGNPDGTMRAIMILGTVYGVIDNNVFRNNEKHIDSYGLNAKSWNNLSFSFGTADNIYYEDNTFYITTTPHSGGSGGRYCARFNTYIDIGTTGLFPWYDMHGNQNVGSNNPIMGAEIYGNTVSFRNGDHSVGIFDQRGGKAIIFNNNVVTSQSVSAKAREEYDDSLVPPAYSPITGQPQHVSDSYYWNNTKNSTTQVLATETEDCCNAIAENSEFFNYDPNFDGTKGIGVGPLSSRPDTCNKGVGWWATDQGGDWNKKNDTVNDGALYKCIAPNTWALYYVPYTYPHPLRTQETGPPPPAPQGLVAY